MKAFPFLPQLLGSMFTWSTRRAIVLSASLAAMSVTGRADPVTMDPANSYAIADSTSFEVGAGYSLVDGLSMGEVEGTLFHQLNDRTMLLASVSGGMGEGDLRILSGGLGLRRMVGDGQTMVGLNGFFDNLQDSSGFSYNQIGMGLEAARGRWFFDVNGYVPIGNTSRMVMVDEVTTIAEVRKATPAHPIETRRAVTTITQVDRHANRGLDAELGYRVFNTKMASLSFAAGYFRAWQGDFDSSGLKLRAQLGLGQHISLGAEWRQNGDAIGQEWRFDATAKFALGRTEGAATPVRDPDGLPTTAGGDTPVVASAPAHSGKEALNVAPTISGKSPKSVFPVLPLVKPDPTTNMLLFAPIQRTVWPSTSLSTSVNFSESFSTHHVRIPSESCNCGPALLFN